MSDSSDGENTKSDNSTVRHFTGSEWTAITLCWILPPLGIVYYFLNYEQAPSENSNHTGKVTFSLAYASIITSGLVLAPFADPAPQQTQPDVGDSSKEEEMTQEEAIGYLDVRSERLDLSGIREEKQRMTEVQFDEADEERAGKLVKMRGYVDEVGESALGTPKLTLTERPRGESIGNALRAKAVFTLDGESEDYTHLDKYEEVVAYGTYDEYYSLAGFDSVQIDDAVVLEASTYDEIMSNQENSTSK